MVTGLLLVVALPLSAAPDSLFGTVRVAGTGEPIPGVIISVQGHAVAAVSGASGAYVLHDLPEGRLEIRFERVGFDPLSIRVVPQGAESRVDIDLAQSAIALSPVTILPPDLAARRPVVDSVESGGIQLTPVRASQDPLVGEPEVFEALAAAPFNHGREELAPSLHVRGGSGDQNLVLLDGIPWHGPRPLGGVVGLLPAGVIAGVDASTAVPAARYGDALSSVIVVHPATGDHFQGSGALDGASVEQSLGGPLPFAGAKILVGGRSTYRSIFDRPEGASASENGFRDVFGHLTLPDRAGRFDIYAVRGSDRLTFPAALDTATGTNRFMAAGTAAGIVATHRIGSELALRTQAWSSGASSDGAWGTRRLESTLQDVGLSAAVSSERTEAGFALTRTTTRYRVRDSAGGVFRLDASPFVASVFAARRWAPAAWWTVSTGLRVNATREGGVQPEPRVWSRVVLGPAVAFSIGLSRTHQYVQSARNEESILDGVLGMDLGLGVGAGGLPPAQADQLIATLETRFGTHALIQLEGYARRLTGLALVAPATGLPFADGPIRVGSGRARGANATVSLTGSRVDVRGTIGVLDAVRRVGQEVYRPGDEALRATVGVDYRPWSRTAVRLVWHAGEGRPTTPLQDALELEPYAPLDGGGSLAGSPTPVAGPVNGTRLPTYARFDVAVTQEWPLLARVATSVTVVNLLDRRNVLAYVSTPDGLRPVFLLPRTLLLRMRWSFEDR